MQERTKNWVPTSYLQDSPSSFFLSHESLKSRKRRIFVPMSYIQGHVRGSRWVRQGWSVAKKRGTWERREEDQGRWSVATRRGREKEEKKKTIEGEKVAPAKARFCVPSTENFFFGSRVFGFEAARLGWSIGSYMVKRKPCAKEVPETDYSTQQKQYLKRTTLCTY